MKQYLFRGKRVDNGEWVEGHLLWYEEGKARITPRHTEIYSNELGDSIYHIAYEVDPNTIGQYTGVNEFVLTDETCNASLFEGDIVEVWGWRTVRGYNQSQYDKRIKVRGVIRFKNGKWCIDYNNNYNESLAKLKGSETQKREVSGNSGLYRYGCQTDREKYRKKQLEYKQKMYSEYGIETWSSDDIKRLGTEFENKDLLEG